jgi:hypothetical protein
VRKFIVATAFLAALGLAALTPREAPAFGWRTAYYSGYYTPTYYYTPSYYSYSTPMYSGVTSSYYTPSYFGGYSAAPAASYYYTPTYSYPAAATYYSPGVFYYGPRYDRSFAVWAPYGNLYNP